MNSNCTRLPRLLVIIGLFLLCASFAAASRQAARADSDGDGLPDALEQALLTQFTPSFMVGQGDCSNAPSEFVPDVRKPTVKAQNGTIYGQVFPVKTAGKAAPASREVEIHFYHLWRADCGKHGHALDAEHVSALVRDSDGEWSAMYWYAAAHENTVCDVSQIARASTLHAVHHGPRVWISPGKHASYLDQAMCEKGCGADRCVAMVPLRVHAIINLGEPGHPMNGSAFATSKRWPLKQKMQTSNFPAETLARVDQLPATEIAWFHAGRHPAQGVIAVSSTTEDALAKGGSETSDALATGDTHTSKALSTAHDSTGNALEKSYRKTIHALGTSASHVRKALGDGTGNVSPAAESPR
ncbi:MAG: hypothetical protein ACRD3F_05535 [Acidobacteriaceae bacterium]